ncbi:hypothetical protein HN587_05155 [Candidatus Woesearchaeota archaeon]|jgi:hydrogenase nickel incorporation protein HypA/HybF|nr:hypothetical protein [Candidatus Woesearchaeota archaeon]
MHEQAIAQQIIEKAKELGQVKQIFVEVGDLGHLPANEMKEVLENRVDWKIIIEEKKATVKCECGYLGEPNIIEKRHASTLYECPNCGNLPQIIDGDKIILTKVEIE